MVTVNIRCSTGTKFSVETEFTKTVEEFKKSLEEGSSVPANQQRLIYKGKVLKDNETLESYGLEADHTVHLVQGSVPAPPQQPTTMPSSAPSTRGNPTNGASVFSGMGAANTGGLPQISVMPNMAQMQEQLLQNPDMMRQIMESPIMQSVMSDPGIVRNMIDSNPAMRQLMEQNPQLNHVMNDPEVLRQTMEAVRNPAAMREMMRSHDTAMRNIESHPEGFNALRRMYQDVEEPMMRATADLATGSTAQTTTSTNSAGSAPNTQPLPNPWASTTPSTSGYTSTGASSGTATAWAELGGGLGTRGDGAAGAGFGSGTGNVDERSALNFLSTAQQNPALQNMMQQMLSDPATLQQMERMNPQLSQMMNANPQMRQMMSNPEFVRAVSDPNNMRAIMQMQQSMQQLQNSGLFPGSGGINPVADSSNAFPGFDFSQMLNAQVNSTPAANPEELYASQLTQLNDMGFTNREQNLRALQQTMGNVNAAVERILSGSA